jgi:peptidyl-prolyl cis-trans isomerase SurA
VAARVNDDIVTNYEIQQRRRFLSLLNAPGDVVAQARETLINERLQVQAARRFGVLATAEEIEDGVTAFASQANMSAQQFINALGQSGVAPETVRDFISVGISWRNVVRARFAASSQVTDAEIDRALAEGGSADAPGVAAVDYATIPIVGGRGGDALSARRR